MKSLARKGEIRNPSLQAVRLDPLTSEIGGDANTTNGKPDIILWTFSSLLVYAYATHFIWFSVI